MSAAEPCNVPIHFTYAPVEEGEQHLCQGDILQPTNEMRSLLREVHPHFSDDKYVAFLVLTQTCDLVPRDGKPYRSHYINLAVVRPLRDVLLRLLDKECKRAQVNGEDIVGVYLSESKQKAVHLLERIIKQNAQAEGLFYLHADAAVQILFPSVALLQVSVAVRAQEHYDTLVAARSGRLKAEFQSKLGWLIGNLFSRVATRDMPESQVKEIVHQFLGPGGMDEHDGPYWVPKDRVTTADKAGVKVAGRMPAEAAALLLKYGKEQPKDVALSRVVVVLRDTCPEIDVDSVEKVRNRLEKDPVFSSACK